MAATVVIDGQVIGRIERSFASEGELFEYIVAWCVQRKKTVDATVTIGSADLFCLKAGSTYHVLAGPSGENDGEGYISVSWVSG